MALDMSGRSLFDMAYECIEEADLGNARELINQSVAQAPENKYVLA